MKIPSALLGFFSATIAEGFKTDNRNQNEILSNILCFDEILLYRKGILYVYK